MSITKTERGWAGHFICADRCRYHRNTLLTNGARHLVVSSVGNLVIDRKIDSVGHERWYETMVWRGHQDGPYIEMDVDHEVNWNTEKLPWGIFGKTPDDLPKDVDAVMDRQHDAIVQWMSDHFDSAWKSARAA